MEVGGSGDVTFLVAFAPGTGMLGPATVASLLDSSTFRR